MNLLLNSCLAKTVPENKGRWLSFLSLIHASSKAFWMCPFPLSLSSSLNKTFVRCTEDTFLTVVPCNLPIVSTEICSAFHFPFLHVVAAPHSLIKFLHGICVKSDLPIKEIPRKRLKWLITAAALRSTGSPPIMSTASICSKRDGLRFFY